MRSKVTKQIIASTPEEVRESVREQANEMVQNNKLMIKIFYKSGQWFAFEAPDRCHECDGIENRVYFLCEKCSDEWEESKKKAKAAALPVLNPEIIKVSDGGVVRIDSKLYIEREEGEDYDWPGTITLYNEKIQITNGFRYKGGYILDLPNSAHSYTEVAEENEQDKQRIDWIRREAITVFELTKGYTPEQREQMGNMLSTMEEMAGYVMELTGSLSATAELERSEKLLQEYREVIRELKNCLS